MAGAAGVAGMGVIGGGEFGVSGEGGNRARRQCHIADRAAILVCAHNSTFEDRTARVCRGRVVGLLTLVEAVRNAQNCGEEDVHLHSKFAQVLCCLASSLRAGSLERAKTVANTEIQARTTASWHAPDLSYSWILLDASSYRELGG
jgi:hypothetical protein